MVKLKCECDYCICTVKTNDYDLDDCYEKLKHYCEETLKRVQGASVKAQPSSPLVWYRDCRNLISDKVKVEQNEGGLKFYGTT